MGSCETGAAEAQVRGGYVYGSAVSAGYGWGKSLRGWEFTSLAVQATLAAWQQPQRMKPAFMTVRDPTPAGLREFLERLPGPDAGKIEVIYLAARHTPAGDWQFTGRGSGALAWNELLEHAPHPRPVNCQSPAGVCRAAR